MKKVSIILVFLMLLFSSCLPQIQAKSESVYGMGLRDPTNEERAWLDLNFPVVSNIKLNSIAFERINQDRLRRGLGKMMSDVAILGDELSFGTSADSEAGSSAASLPATIDNSISTAFPPIRSQGGVGSCVAWATTYYQFSYEVNLALGRDAKGQDGLGVNANIFSPKWTYNMINGGVDGGSYFSGAYNLILKNGAANWAAFPYDSNYLQWCMNSQAWRDAINYRATSWGRLSNSNVDQLIADIKTHLANGHILVIGTYVNSWVRTTINNDPSNVDDDAYVGKYIASYMKNTALGGHGMTLVGYSDSIWCDLNSNGVVEAGERGAFKIANSWGTGDWNQGYRWVTYDSLRAVSNAPSSGTWPTSDRASNGIFRGSDIYALTVSGSYHPTYVAQFTLNAANRGQIMITLGSAAAGSLTPTSSWSPAALSYSGGAYAFDGTTIACDATFYLDFSDLATSTTTDQRWFLSTTDSVVGNPTTIRAYSLYKTDAGGDVLLKSSSATPTNVDGSNSLLWVDYKVNDVNSPPNAYITATPLSGTMPLNVNFDGSASMDPDGEIVGYDWVFGDSYTGSGQTVTHTYSVAGIYTTTLTVTDDKGAKGSMSVSIQVTDPNVVNAPSGLVAKAGRGTLTLSWVDNSNNEDGFIIEVSTKVKGGYSSYSPFKTTQTNSWSGTMPSGSYRFRVRAYKGTMYSGYSNEAMTRVR